MNIYSTPYFKVTDAVRTQQVQFATEIANWMRAFAPLFEKLCPGYTAKRDKVVGGVVYREQLGSGLIAQIGLFIMEVEEERVVDIDCVGGNKVIIPEAARAVVSRISEDSQKRWALMQCVLKNGGLDGGPVWKEKFIKWWSLKARRTHRDGEPLGSDGARDLDHLAATKTCDQWPALRNATHKIGLVVSRLLNKSTLPTRQSKSLSCQHCRLLRICSVTLISI